MNQEFNEDDSTSFVMKIVIIVAAIVVFICLFLSQGCRTKTEATYQYFESGKIQAQSYKADTGFMFFSEGANKTLSPSLSVNGVSF